VLLFIMKIIMHVDVSCVKYCLLVLEAVMRIRIVQHSIPFTFFLERGDFKSPSAVGLETGL
jgi:hypothetical protein